MNKNTVVISIVILIGCVILGLFYYLTKTNEQKLLLELQKNDKVEQNLQESTETFVRESCYNEAIEDAQSLLQDKIDILKSQSNISYADRQLLQGYEEAVKKGMYLKDDFNTSYELCLSKNGLEK